MTVIRKMVLNTTNKPNNSLKQKFHKPQNKMMLKSPFTSWISARWLRMEETLDEFQYHQLEKDHAEMQHADIATAWTLKEHSINPADFST